MQTYVIWLNEFNFFENKLHKCEKKPQLVYICTNLFVLSNVNLFQVYEQSLNLQKLRNLLSKSQKKLFISDCVGSDISITIADIFRSQRNYFFISFESKEIAAFHLNDFEVLLPNHSILFFPSSYRKNREIDNSNILMRTEVLNQINSSKPPSLIISYHEALFEKVMSNNELDKKTVRINVGERLNIDLLNETLFEYQFSRVDFVTDPGEFSVRGGIVDVFSFSNENPYRIEFFGDYIESIRTFDIETQLSIQVQESLQIIPNIDNVTDNKNLIPFLDFVNKQTLFWIQNISSLFEGRGHFFDGFRKTPATHQNISLSNQFCSQESLKLSLKKFSVVEFGSYHNSNFCSEMLKFDVSPQPSFNKQFGILVDDLNEKYKKGYENYICCSNEQQASRFHDIFNDYEVYVNCKVVVLPLHQGFVNHELKITCYTDHQIFERYNKFRLKNRYAKKQSITLREINGLEIGDYVTHIDHGIGKFGGLKKIDVNGTQQEAIKLYYGERDILYLSIHSLYKVTKFSGKDGKVPKIYKLGSKAWKSLKHKTKSKVKEIAFNLIKLYAKRKLQKGFQYSPDSAMQLELESSFVYEDTPDQIKTTSEIKFDMESNQPMDRLVCGDVGFGKTEVAIRAAFKAVDNGKQVAVLVPTTILAFQHSKTFKSRLNEFPVRIDYLNRFKSLSQKKEILKQLKSGAIDIIIGTHQLVNKSVEFKDLGLLIVDEEQKFGVAVKDKLKTLKENIDVLTLTATPIPRTLQFSLMAARDLSVINTPPINRFPIESQVIRMNRDIIKEGIKNEINRSGQVFFVHNRIENIIEVASFIQNLVPDAKIAIGHGKLEGKKLEKLMLDFMEGYYDVLVSTTIVESGLDVPNANTIFINNANNFGLSDLHQMRGRVGRSNRKAFCYFITPEFHAMTADAKKRISALQQYTALGSGFSIAMKDLEIRGAGDILGGEQSGFINEIGFDTYQKILNEAIEELKENEFQKLFNQDLMSKKHVKELSIDSDFSLLFPDDYINNIKERLRLYTDLNKVTNQKELKSFKLKLIDRFGPLPIEVNDLLKSIKLKWLGVRLGMQKIIMREKKFIGYFIDDQKSIFFDSQEFSKVLAYVQKDSKSCSLKQKTTRSGLRLILTIENICTVNDAVKSLSLILE